MSDATAHPLDGIDLMPVLTGRENPQERTIFWRTTHRTRQAAVHQGRWKYLRDEDQEYLFDLVLDPGERQDRRLDEAERFYALKAELAAWEEEMLSPVPV